MTIKDFKTYIITIKDPKEIVKTVDRVKKFGLKNIEIFKGVIGKDIEESYIKNNLTIRAQYELKNGRFSHFPLSGVGSIGCYLSHVNLWEKIKDTNETIIILEDDFDTNKSIDYLEKSYLDAKNNNFDILRFAYIYSIINDKPPQSKKNINKYLTKYNFEFGTQGYIINSRGANKLLKEIYPIDVQIDSFMNIYQNLNIDFNMFYTKKNFNNGLELFNNIVHNNIRMTDTFRLIFGILITLMFLLFIYICYRLYIRYLPCQLSRKYIY